MGNILVVKKPSILREGIVSVLQERIRDYKITCCELTNKHQLKKHDDTELVMLDLDVNLDLSAVIKYYKSHGKKVILWTSNQKDNRLIDCFKFGLHGYFYTGMEEIELISGIKSVLKGEVYIYKDFIPLLLKDYMKITNKQAKKPMDVFSNREWEVLEMMTQGYSNEEIADIMNIAVGTVKGYVSSILKKMNVTNRTNAVLLALKNEWFYL